MSPCPRRALHGRDPGGTRRANRLALAAVLVWTAVFLEFTDGPPRYEQILKLFPAAAILKHEMDSWAIQ